MPISRGYLGTAQPPASINDFYFLRHGATDLNEKEKELLGQRHWGVQGAGTNIALNAKGKRQAVLAGSVLRKLPISLVVCSPLLRAIQTAFIGNIHCHNFEIDDDLKERDFGKHEGGYGPLKMFEDNYPDCEDTEIFSTRVAKALNYANSSDNVLFVSHGGVLRVIAALLGVDLSNDHTANGRVLHFKRGVSHWTVEIYQSPVILVRDPTRGIAKVIAENLIAYGYRLSLSAPNVKDLEAGFGLQDEWLHYARFDPGQQHDAMSAWVNAVVDKFGRIDGFVNSAISSGGSGSGSGSGSVSLEKDIDYINCVGPLDMIELCLPYLVEAASASASGRFVNVNSISWQNESNPFFGFNIPKHALQGLPRAVYMAGTGGVQFKDICPCGPN